MNYDEFRAHWYNTHPNSIPKAPSATSDWIKMGLWFIIYLGSAILSGAHSIPAIAKTIPVDGLISTDAANIIAFSGFFFVELTLFVNSLHRSVGWLGKITTTTALSTAVVANIYSSMAALSVASAAAESNDAVTGFFLIFVALVIGISAPLTALLSGERIHALEVDSGKKNKGALDEYNETMQKLDAVINRAYSSYLNAGGSKQSEPTESENKEKLLGQSEVEELLRNSPEVWTALVNGTAPAKEIAAYLGTSQATLSKAKKALLNG